MPQGSPVIDGFDFALAGASIQGTWGIGELARLRDMVATPAGAVGYAIRGERDEQGRPALRVAVQGTLQLRCQRCLEPFAFEVRAEELLVLAASQAEIDAEPADVNAADRVVAGRQMPVRELIEDELLLALPYAPRHESCSAARSSGARQGPSPFAGLRGLVRGKH